MSAYRRQFIGMVVVLLFLVLPEIKAQETISVQPAAIPVEILEETARRERAYEVPIRNALSEYFEKGSYIVDAKLELKESLLPKGYKKAQTSDLDGYDLESLPGLPMIPQQLTRGQRNTGVKRDSLLPTSFDRVYLISNVRINVIVPDTFTDEEVAFAKALIQSVAKLNQYRGDVVIVDKRPFPKRKTDSSSQPGPLTLNEEVIVEKNEDPKITEESSEKEITQADVPQPAQPQPEEPKTFVEQFTENPVNLVLSGLLLLVLILLLILLSRMNKANEVREAQVGRPKQDNQNDTSSSSKENSSDANVAQLKEVIEEFKQQLLAPIVEDNKKMEKIEAPSDELIARYETDRSYITSQCLSNADSVAGVLIEWMETDQEQGPVRAAQAIASINPKLLATLKPILGVENHNFLESVLDDMEPLDIREKVKVARAFTHGVKQTKAGKSPSATYSDMFGFMGQLTDEQVIHLLKEEDDDIAAIALAQLGSTRINRLLKMFEIDKRVVLLTKMGKITSLPVSSYKDIATQLARKALEVSNMKYVVADGIQSIINVIDDMPIAEQDEYLDKIALTDIELVKKVRSMFVSFSDLPNLSEDQLVESVANLDKQILVYALHDAPEQTVEKLLALRGSRERMIIENDLENLGKVDAALVEDARRQLLLAVRQSMKGQPA